MAGTTFSYASNQAQTYRKSGLILEAELRCLSFLLCGEDPRSIIHVEPSTGTNRGVREVITFQPWNHQPTGFGWGQQVWGNEDVDTQMNDYLDIAYIGLAKRARENEIYDQNVVEFSMKESNDEGLAHDSATIAECSFFHQLAGYTPVNRLTLGGTGNKFAYQKGKTKYTHSWGNPTVEPDAAHHFFCPGVGGPNANEAAVAADVTAMPTNRVVEAAFRKLAGDQFSSVNGNLWPMVPAMTPWGEGYVYLGSREALSAIKEQSSDSDVYDLARACIEGGMDPENSTLWTNEGFKLRNIFYLASDFITLGTTGTAGSDTAGAARANVERGLLLGARAGHIRFGEKFSRSNWLGYFQTRLERRFSEATDTVAGMNVCIPNNGSRTETGAQRWGCGVLSNFTERTVARYD